MEKQRRLKAVILTTLIIGVLTISVAFSALSRTLNISGVGKMDTAKWDVRFENLREPEITRDAVQVTEPKIMDDGGVVGDINVKLTKPKDEISYKVDIANNGTIDAEVNIMTIADLSGDEKKLIDFGVYYQNGSKILKYDLLEPGDKKTIIIKIRYKDDITEFDLPSEPLEIKLSCQIDYVQSDAQIVITPNGSLEKVESVLANGTSSYYTSSFFNGTISKDKIESIEFLNTLKVPTDVKATAWDASLNKDGSVVAWYTDLDNNGLYELNIGGNKKVYAPPNSSNLFRYFINLTQIHFNNNFVLKDITNASYMFQYCTSLTSLDLSSFDTSKVTDMNSMFSNCTSLTSLDLSSFDTSNVINMSSMFMSCGALTELDLSLFNTGNVTNMGSMFFGCKSLTELDLSNFNTTKVTKMYSLFRNCITLKSLNISTFNTSITEDMSYMFLNCYELTSVNLNLIYNSSVIVNMYSMFYNCLSLTSININDYGLRYATNIIEMFYGCSSLTELDLSWLDTSGIKDMSGLFSGCSSLTKLNLASFNTSNVTDMSNMFSECSSLVNLDLSSFDTSKVKDYQFMFKDCFSLMKLNITKAKFENVTFSNSMFSSVPTGINIYVKDEAAKTFIQARKSDANVIIGAPIAYNYNNINDKLYLSI